MKFRIRYSTPFMLAGKPALKAEYFLEASSIEEAIRKFRSDFTSDDHEIIYGVDMIEK